jgi:hypothetical protein
MSDINASSLQQEIMGAYDRIAQRALELLQSTVPIDSGDLYDSLEVVPVNDVILDGVSDVSESIMGTLEDLGL